MATDEDTGTTSARVGTPPPPPRITGVPAIDIAAIAQWASDFYKAVVLQNLYLQEAGQFDPDNFNPSDLPDPASSNIATAQQTANEAYTLAAQNAAIIEDRLGVPLGSAEVVDAATTFSVTFATADVQPNTSYFVFIQCYGFTGAPPLAATQVVDITRSTTGFTATVNTAPGVGNSTKFFYFVTRD